MATTPKSDHTKGPLSSLAELGGEDSVATPLPLNELSHIVNPKTDEKVTVPLVKAADHHQHILVALDPEGAHDQAVRSLEAAKKLARAEDTVILLSVLPPMIVRDPGAYAMGIGYTATYDVEWQLDALRKLRAKRLAQLKELSSGFAKGVRVLVQVVHGGTEIKILKVAEEHACDLIIMGKRKMGMWEKLVHSSVSNYVTSHAGCSVLVAKELDQK